MTPNTQLEVALGRDIHMNIDRLSQSTWNKLTK